MNNRTIEQTQKIVHQETKRKEQKKTDTLTDGQIVTQKKQRKEQLTHNLSMIILLGYLSIR